MKAFHEFFDAATLNEMKRLCEEKTEFNQYSFETRANNKCLYDSEGNLIKAQNLVAAPNFNNSKKHLKNG
jgi:hypothetical protein